ncbi:hypothetical protein ACFCV3_01995 [Kribbella sp. NPDC056345]|uniref:hypothetical protein n=1 Tax=Kribbella sp. NPDC056345 TaxID=3345789 RepID=UPI0035E069AD
MALTATAVLGMGMVSMMAAPTAGAAEAGVTATCGYRVVWDSSAVKENPWPTAEILKWKHEGDLVTGPCKTVFNEVSGTTWTAVHCTCADDDEGWMREVSLRQTWRE